MRNVKITRSLAIMTGCVVLSLFCVLYPMYVIQPFRAQGPRELEAALFLMRIRTVLTLVFAAVTLLVAVLCWRLTVKQSARIAIIAAAFVACVCAVVAQVNVFEWMFHPVGAPTFESAAEVKLDADEKVLAVRCNGVARAYPIRAIAYHHVVNDTVGGVPIVATY